MLAPLQSAAVQGTEWVEPFVADFRARFQALLAGAFRSFPPALALSILDPKLSFSEAETQAGVAEGTVIVKADGSAMSPYDLKRLQVGRKRKPGRVAQCWLSLSLRSLSAVICHADHPARRAAASPPHESACQQVCCKPAGTASMLQPCYASLRTDLSQAL